MANAQFVAEVAQGAAQGASSVARFVNATADVARAHPAAALAVAVTTVGLAAYGCYKAAETYFSPDEKEKEEK